jgi:hypothetical protein
MQMDAKTFSGATNNATAKNTKSVNNEAAILTSADEGIVMPRKC